MLAAVPGIEFHSLALAWRWLPSGSHRESAFCAIGNFRNVIGTPIISVLQLPYELGG